MGLLEHYGNIGAAIAFPLAFSCWLVGLRTLERFADATGSVINPAPPGAEDARLELRRRLGAPPARIAWYLLFVAIGMGYTIASRYWLTDPAMTHARWGHDVFDSLLHPAGYTAQVIFFVVWWGWLLPWMGVRLVIVIRALREFFLRIRELDALDLQPMHPDGAGGLGRLGRASLWFNFGTLSLTAIPAALYLTHGLTATLLFGASLLIVALPVVFFLPLATAHGVMRDKRDELLEFVHERHRTATANTLRLLREPTLDEEGRSQLNAELEHIGQLDGLYSNLQAMPVWPFDWRTIIQFSASVVVPAVLWLVELVSAA